MQLLLLRISACERKAFAMGGTLCMTSHFACCLLLELVPIYAGRLRTRYCSKSLDSFEYFLLLALQRILNENEIEWHLPRYQM